MLQDIGTGSNFLNSTAVAQKITAELTSRNLSNQKPSLY
jgi:hypothetical protein